MFRRSLYQKRDSCTGVFCEFYEISKNTFSEGTAPVAGSKFCHKWWITTRKSSPFKRSIKIKEVQKIILLFLRCTKFFIWDSINIKHKSICLQNQPFRGALRKKCSKKYTANLQETRMLKCDFNKIALQLYVNSCKFAAYFQNTLS